MDDPLALQSMPLEHSLVLVVISLALVLLNAFFVAAEFSIVKVRRTRLEELEAQGNRLAKHALVCVSHLDEYLSATQLGITVVSLALGWIGETSFHHLFLSFLPGDWLEHSKGIRVLSTVASFLTITCLHVVLGELVPKSMAIQQAERVALWIAQPLILFYRCTRPMILLFTWAANSILKLLGFHQTEEQALTEEELKIVVSDSREDGIISESEAKIIQRAFSFSDKNASEIMTRADRIKFISLARSSDENKAYLMNYKHTRFPICKSDFNEVIGIANMKDFHFLTDFDEATFRRLAHPVTFVYNDTKQDQILKLFSQTKTQLAIVRDRQTRKNLGVVTVTDVIEQLVGEVKDEHGH